MNNHPVIISYYCHYNELLLSPFCIIKDFGDYGNSKKKFCIFLYEYAGNIKKPVNLHSIYRLIFRVVARGGFEPSTPRV